MEWSLTWYCHFFSWFVSIFTARYLTLSVGYSLLRRNFIFKSPSNLFYLDFKITISAFFTFSGILFAFNQLTRRFKDAATDTRYFERSKFFMSSVQKKNFSLIRQVVFKLGSVFCQETYYTSFEFECTRTKVGKFGNSR